MNIHEHQAKEILKEYGVPVSNGVVVFKLDKIKEAITKLNSEKFVIKAQIHAGGRGKAGGVKLVKNINDLEVMGPVDSPFLKIKKKYRSRLLIRFKEKSLKQKEVSNLLNSLKISNKIKLTVDVDPVNFG